MNIVVVGAGAIGKERIKALEMLGEEITIVDKIDVSSQFPNHTYYGNLNHAIDDIASDFVFICVPHDQVLDMICEFEEDDKFLIEKPCGRTVKECNDISQYAYVGSKINVGFNYRFFKGVNQLLIDCKNKVFGDLISVNMVLALGDAPGTEKTWRLDPEQAGRGAILDPGIHLVDLMLQMTNKPLKAHAFHSTYAFFNTGIEEECHLIASDGETIFNLQASKVRWRNEFKIQVNGTEGYGIVEGRDRNYGCQTYRTGKRWGWMSGKPQCNTEEIKVIGYNGEDSFYEETKAVLYGTDSIIQPATWQDNLKCLQFIEKL